MWAELRWLLLGFTLLPFEPVADFDAAARIDRRCRQEGVTPRGLLDCLIAAVAHRREATILAHDANLARIAQVMGIPLDPSTAGLF